MTAIEEIVLPEKLATLLPCSSEGDIGDDTVGNETEMDRGRLKSRDAPRRPDEKSPIPPATEEAARGSSRPR